MDAFATSPALLLGICLGGDAVLMVLSVLVAGAYGERLLLLHAGGIALAIVVTVLQASPWAADTPQALMAAMAVACLHLRALTGHVGSLRPRQRWMSGAAAGILAIAVADFVLPWKLLPAATAVWLAVAVLVTLRAWPQSRPWVLWTVPGHLALAAAAVRLGLSGGYGPDPVLAAILSFWSMALYLASVWRSRVFGEDQSRQAVAETLNPLTGLSTPTALMQRVEAARSLMRRYGHPGSLLLVHVEYLALVSERLGAETAEAVALEAGTRIRNALGDGDVAARMGFQRFAVLSEGTSPKDVSAQLAARVLTAGLRAPLAAVPGNYLNFRVVICDLPPSGVVITELLEQMGELLDAEVLRARDKRIRIVRPSELKLTTVPGGLPQVLTTQY